jgi:transposase-like protein
MTRLPITSIRLDGGTQPRAAINVRTVSDYMADMAGGTEFPPVDVFYDGASYWLADGFHRIKAAEKANLTELACEVHQGTQQDAQWFSFGANKANGLRRTNQDKQRAVKTALQHASGASLSDEEIAQHVGVSGEMVRKYRRRIESTSKDWKSTRRKGRDGRTIDVTKIGKPKEGSPTPAPLAAPGPVEPEGIDADNETVVSCGPGRITRSQKIDRLARLTLAFIESTKHLAHLVGWLGETAGEFEHAEQVLSHIRQAIATASVEIEEKAVAADPLNAFRLEIQEKNS